MIIQTALNLGMIFYLLKNFALRSLIVNH
jgi:hypothetical protein